MSNYHEVVLRTKTKEYPIIVGRGVINDLPKFMKGFRNSKKCAVITNNVVRSLYGGFVQKLLSNAGYEAYVIEVPNGEDCKDLRVVERVYDELISYRFDRYSTVIALGGGSTGDLAGFIAATYMRGINYIQVPTTLLAQVDAAIGGKAAINHPKGKNLIGVFYHPQLVLVDVDMLKTHDFRDLRSGLAEIIKYGIIMDSEFFKYVVSNKAKLLDVSSEELLKAVLKCCEFKASIVSKDEFDREGIRAILNFGHTVGHAVETYSNFTLRHGEAVSIGMCYEAKVSAAIGFASKSVADEVCRSLSDLGLPTRIEESAEVSKLLDLMRRDKKSVGGKIAMVLLKDIGSSFLMDSVPEEVVLEVMRSW
ncbi:MAG: 3-dehydroquinate synthase [Sulfolobales archaeon]|nr:3-dehydroquinate synthase [Sulfolobales archaeon]